MILPSLLIGLVAATVALFAWRRVHHRRARIHLRLLVGRSRLLGEEIDRRAGELATQFGDGEIESVCVAARNSLDQLQVSILDRQAQLQNYEDLAFQQRHKLAILDYAQRHPPEPGEDHPALTDETEAQLPRDRIEQSLLDNIDDARERGEEEE